MWPVINKLHDQGKLIKAQQLILAWPKPKEELYDLQKNPYEINNLAQSSGYRDVLKKLRSLLDGWIEDTGDTGLAQMHPFQMKRLMQSMGLRES